MNLYFSDTVARSAIVLLAAVAGCAATPQSSSKDTLEPRQAREQILGAMASELDRSMETLRYRDFESPYFIAYSVVESESIDLSARFGSVVSDDTTQQRSAYVEVRVGDYDFDNFANVEGESFRMSDYDASRRAPVDGDPDGIRGTLWLLTDETYKKAISDYLTKKGGSVYSADDETDVASFSTEAPIEHRDRINRLELDRDDWKNRVRILASQLKGTPDILDSSVDVSARQVVRYFINSEGTTFISDQVLYSVQMTAYARADDGMLLDNGRTFYTRNASDLPDLETLKAEAGEMLSELLALREAPVLDPYSGPAILAPEAAGVLFHEVIGHRLEGERQRNEEEGRTFKGRLGKQVIPEFLSVVDDPTTAEFEGTQLNGWYRVDDEGVLARPARLIEAGILREYLKSRTPIEGSPQSNGHGRAQGIRKPIARMSNLYIESDSAHQVDYDTLKSKLIGEVKSQGKPFGLIIRDITGGSTNTSGWGYQAFKGTPRMIFKVDPETGEETLVRGVELVGTPLTSINKIIAASDERDIFNGYCGAESGYVPVSTVAPALLTTEVELQRKQESKQRGPILAPPWAQD